VRITLDRKTLGRTFIFLQRVFFVPGFFRSCFGAEKWISVLYGISLSNFCCRIAWSVLVWHGWVLAFS